MCSCRSDTQLEMPADFSSASASSPPDIAAQKPALRVVPCGGCQTCCRTQWVFLDPDAGDVVALYDTVAIVHPKTGVIVQAVAHKPNGDCLYQSAAGCTIHDRAPSKCRAFDCRLYFRDMMMKPRQARKQELRDLYSAKELFEIGRAMQQKYPANEPVP